MPSVRAEFDPNLESLRGIAALSVALAHSFAVFVDLADVGAAHQWAWQVYGWLGTAMPPGGGVILFFVLSGYVLGHSLERNANYTDFIIRRAFRIFPALWLSLIVAFAVLHLLAVPRPTSGTTDWFINVYWPTPTWGDLALNAVLWKSNVNAVAWTLLPEVIGSLLLPVFVIVHAHTKNAGRFGLLLALCAAGTITGRPSIQFLFCFYLGFMLPRLIAPLVKTRVAGILTATLGTAMIIAGNRYGTPYTGPMRFASGFGAAILISAVISEPRPWRWLSFTPLRFLGRISYSFYLLHLPILYCCAALALTLPPEFRSGILTNMMLAAVSIPAAGIVAAATHSLVERPAIRFSRAFTSVAAWSLVSLWGRVNTTG
jgi:peptidoglycan/LPS O-acetylase OafA/YrhL